MPKLPGSADDGVVYDEILLCQLITDIYNAYSFLRLPFTIPRGCSQLVFFNDSYFFLSKKKFPLSTYFACLSAFTPKRL